MKTLNLISVVESTILANAVEVAYEDIQLSVAANATVEAVDTNSVVVGTPVSKYFGTELRMHPVGRDSKGRFVSIKDTAEDIVDAAIENAADLLGFVFEDDSNDLPQPSTQVTAPLEESEEEVVDNVVTAEVTMEKGFEPCTLNFASAADKPAVSRRLFALASPEFAFDTEPQPVQVQAPVYVESVDMPEYVDLEGLETMQTYDHPPMDAYEDTHYVQDEFDYDLSDYEVNVPSVTGTATVYTKLDVIGEVCNAVHTYFTNSCMLRSINTEQIRQQFTIAYKQYMPHLANYSKDVGNVITYIMQQITEAYGRRTYVYRDVFAKILSDVLNNVMFLANKKYAA